MLRGRGKISLDLCGFPGGKMKRQGIYTFTPENAVLLRNILVSAPIRKPGRGGYVDSCRVPALFRSTNLNLIL